MKKLFGLIILTTALVCLLAACDLSMLPNTQPKEDVITVVDGYLVVNGVMTEYKVDTVDEITVVNGYLVVNGVITEYKVDSKDVITIEDGYLVVNGVKTEYEIKNKNHTFGEWKLYNPDATDCENKLYYRTCSDCGTIEWRDGKYEDHRFNTVTTKPTCQAGGYDTKTCKTCGKVEICNEKPKTGHEYGMQHISDSNYHWKECKTCGESGTKSAHIVENGICIVCDPSVQPTEGVVYDLSADKTYAEVVGYEGTTETVIIASEYNGLPVKNIYDGAFRENNIITSVIIPDSVITIGWEAFAHCYSLSSVVIGDSVTTIGDSSFIECYNLSSVIIGDSVITIGWEAFAHCYILSSVVIPDSVTYISEQAFFDCSNLSSVIIGDSVTTIGSDAFAYCSSLSSVVIPDSVTYIGERAFYDCSNLELNVYGYCKYLGTESNPYFALLETTSKNYSSYEIHSDTKIIADYAFSNCSRLTEIAIPDSVTTIGGSAFSSCSSLSSVVIGDSVTTIGNYAFAYCSSLSSVVIPDSVTYIGERAFYGCSNLKTVYYTGSKEDWAKISIGYPSSYLTGATIYYNYVPEN